MPYLFSPGVHKGIQEVQLNEEGCSQAVLLLQSNNRGSQEKGRSGKYPPFLNSGILNEGFAETHNLTICQAKKNADAVKKAKEKSSKLAASSRYQEAFQNSSSQIVPRQSREISTPASCADVIKTNTELSKEAGKGKTNTKVAALGKAIAATPDSVICSAAEKSSLKEQVTLLDVIATALEAFVKDLKEAIKV